MPQAISRRRFNTTLMGLGLSLALSSAAFAQDTKFSLGMSTTPTTLDPHEDSSSPNNAMSRHIFDSLINRGGAAETNPQLATEWKVLDETHWQFKLRDGIKFHDGSTFDSADVVASIIRARDKPSQGFASYTRNIANVTAPDALTVIVETSTPEPMLLNSLSRIRIISADHADANVQAFEDGTAAVGTGPFKFASFAAGDRLDWDCQVVVLGF